MTLFQAIFLGIVQGLTEYLPVSSSAHLVLVPNLLGWQFSEQEAFIFDVLVQLGTLVGVLLYFFEPLRRVILAVIKGLMTGNPWGEKNARLGWMVALATFPAALIGLLFKDELAAYFSSPIAACYCLIATGLIMIMAEQLSKKFERDINYVDALSIGMAQSFALLPGISRSGSTIAAGMARGFSRLEAAQFSFLMSIPVMVGASLIASIDLIKEPALLNKMALPLVAGFLAAAFSGYIVIKWFMNFVGKHRLFLFSGYCIVVGIAGILFFSF